MIEQTLSKANGSVHTGSVHTGSVRNACQALAVSESGYRAWCKRKAQGPTLRQRQERELTDRIVAIHNANHKAYGSPRIYKALREAGVPVSKHRVAKLFRQAGLGSRRASKRKRVQTTDSDHDLPVAPNRLDRAFTAAAPNQKWVADTTYIPTKEGWFYLAVILDLFSRKVVGWATGTHFTSKLVGRALSNALALRPPPALLHSDRSVQYASHAHQQQLRQAHIQPTMSRRADCHDNAVMESFFASVKGETVLAERVFVNRAEARAALFAYIEGFYNPRRMHSTLGYLSPDEFERAAAAAAARSNVA
jgi:transposase InsO family protein